MRITFIFNLVIIVCFTSCKKADKWRIVPIEQIQISRKIEKKQLNEKCVFYHDSFAVVFYLFKIKNEIFSIKRELHFSTYPPLNLNDVPRDSVMVKIKGDSIWIKSINNYSLETICTENEYGGPEMHERIGPLELKANRIKNYR